MVRVGNTPPYLGAYTSVIALLLTGWTIRCSSQRGRKKPNAHVLLHLAGRDLPSDGGTRYSSGAGAGGAAWKLRKATEMASENPGGSLS